MEITKSLHTDTFTMKKWEEKDFNTHEFFLYTLMDLKLTSRDTVRKIYEWLYDPQCGT